VLRQDKQADVKKPEEGPKRKGGDISGKGGPGGINGRRGGAHPPHAISNTHGVGDKEVTQRGKKGQQIIKKKGRLPREDTCKKREEASARWGYKKGFLAKKKEKRHIHPRESLGKKNVRISRKELEVNKTSCYKYMGGFPRIWRTIDG